MNFGLSAALLALVAMIFVVAPFLMRGRKSPQDQRHAVIAIVKARLDELARDRVAGILDDNTYQQLMLEQQRRLLQETEDTAAPLAAGRGRGLLIAVALLLPLCAGGFYFYFGAWSDWQIQNLLDQSQRETQSGADNRATLEDLASALEHRLERRDDDDGRRRFMLARIDTEFGRYQAALVQYAALQAKFPEDSSIAAQYAQALYLAADRKLTPEVTAQAQRALQADPNQTTALGLLGIAAFEQKDYAQALLHWRHLLQQLPSGSPNAGLIERGIQQAEQALAALAPSGPKLVVSVSIDPQLLASVPAGGTLFVFAKAVNGPPMPLAVARLDPKKLPLQVTLDDSMAMAPGMNLSSAKQVQITARITASGQVRGEPGDLEGGSAAIDVTGKATAVQLTIDRRL